MNNEPAPPAPARPGWLAEARATIASVPDRAAFSVLLVAWVLLFHFLGNSVKGYVDTPSLFGWLSFTYAMREDDWHGFIIPFVVLGFLWWKRGELAAAPKRAWWPALVLVAVALGLHLLGFLVQQTRISIVGFFIGLWGLAGAVWGPAVLRATFFPMFLTVFCVPIAAQTDTLTFPLRKVATTVAVKFCQWVLSIGVQQHGTNIIDPDGSYQYDVAAACSGIRSLTAIFALTSAYTFVFFTRGWKRLSVILLAIPLAIFSNVLRLLTVIVVSEVAKSSARSDGLSAAEVAARALSAGNYVHDNPWISLLPYVVAFIGVFLLAHLLKEDRQLDVVEVAIPVGASLGVFYLLSKIFHVTREHGLPGGPGAMVIIAPALVVLVLLLVGGGNPIAAFTRQATAVSSAAALLVAASVGLLKERQASIRLSPPGVKVVDQPIYAEKGTNRIHVSDRSIFLPENVGGYQSKPLPMAAIVSESLPPDTTFGQRRYVAPDGFIIDTIVVLMGADRTSIHNPQYCLEGQNFKILPPQRDTIRIPRPMPYEMPVNKIIFGGEAQMEDGARRRLGGAFVYWYVSDREVTAEFKERMVDSNLEMLRTGVMTRWAYVICMAATPPGREEEAYERIKKFIAASVPEYQTTAGRPAVEAREPVTPGR